MYAVRTKSGRVIGRYATRAEAERACRTAKSPARSPRRTEVEEATAYKAQLAHEASLMPGIRVRLRRGSMTGLEGVLTGRREGGFGVRFDDGFTGVVESRNREIVHQGSPIRGPARTRLLKVHADVSRRLYAKSPIPKHLRVAATEIIRALQGPAHTNTPYQLAKRFHPGTDQWMMGDRYGTVTRANKDGTFQVKMDRSGRSIKVRREHIGEWM